MGIGDGWGRDAMAFNSCVWVDVVLILSFNKYFLST